MEEDEKKSIFNKNNYRLRISVLSEADSQNCRFVDMVMR